MQFRIYIKQQLQLMMASSPSFGEEESPPTSLFPKRKRRFKIFQSHAKSEPDRQESTIEIKVSPSLVKQDQPEPCRQVGISSGFVKIPKKMTLQNQFYGEDDIQLLQVPSTIQGICTVGSQKFCNTDQFEKERLEPSVLILNDLLVINQDSVLFKSISEMKNSTNDFMDQTHLLKASVLDLKTSVKESACQCQDVYEKLKQLQQFLTKMRKQHEILDERIEVLNDRADELEIRRSLQSGQLKDSGHEDELKVFIEEKGYKVEIDEDEDQFAVTQIVPAYLINQFLQMRKIRALEQHSSAKKQHKYKIKEAVQAFHPCLGMNEQKYHKLTNFIADQSEDKTADDVVLSLIFRKGTVDLDTQWVGEQEQLEYKESLLFILRNSMKKVLGGFISNHLIEGQVRQDPHAFLFSLQEECHKLKVKEESAAQAYESSKHYMVCFGSDMMISSDCLQEQSYCEWPSSYEGKNQESMTWLAGDFSFMIEHIEVYEVTMK